MKGIKQKLIALGLSSSIVLGAGVLSFADEVDQTSVQANGTVQAGAIKNDVTVNGNGNCVSTDNSVTNINKTEMNSEQGASAAKKPGDATQTSVQANGTVQAGARKNDVTVNGNGNGVSTDNSVTNVNKTEMNSEQGDSNGQKPTPKPDCKPDPKPDCKPGQKPDGDKITQGSTQANGTIQGGIISNNVNINGDGNNVNINNTINNINNTYMNSSQSVNKTTNKVASKKVIYKKSTVKSTAKSTTKSSNPKTGDESLVTAFAGLVGAGAMLAGRKKIED